MNRVRLGRRLLLGVISAGILAAVLAPAASAHSVSVTMTCNSVTYSDFKSFPGPENVTFTAFVNNVQVAQTNANVTDSSDPVMLTFTAPPGMDDIEANAYDNTEGSSLPGFPQDTRLICGLPVATMPPSITGATRQRSALTLTHAQWSNAPTSIADQWERCDSAGANCTAIGGGTADTYQLSSLDVGHTIRVSETATNAAGASSPSNSAATEPVAPPVALPVGTMPPSITGATRQHSALTLTHAQWSNAPTSIADQWERCDSAGANCTAIGGATADTYQVSSLDVGHTIRVSETATNAAGASSPSSSAATEPVAPPVAKAAVSLGRTRVSGQAVNQAVTCRGDAGALCRLTFTLTITERIAAGKLVALIAAKRRVTEKLVVVASKTLTLASGRGETVTVTLNPTGRRLLAARRTLSARFTVSAAGTRLHATTVVFRTKPRRSHGGRTRRGDR